MMTCRSDMTPDQQARGKQMREAAEAFIIAIQSDPRSTTAEVSVYAVKTALAFEIASIETKKEIE